MMSIQDGSINGEGKSRIVRRGQRIMVMSQRARQDLMEKGGGEIEGDKSRWSISCKIHDSINGSARKRTLDHRDKGSMSKDRVRNKPEELSKLIEGLQGRPNTGSVAMKARTHHPQLSTASIRQRRPFGRAPMFDSTELQ